MTEEKERKYHEWVASQQNTQDSDNSIGTSDVDANILVTGNSHNEQKDEAAEKETSDRWCELCARQARRQGVQVPVLATYALKDANGVERWLCLSHYETAIRARRKRLKLDEIACQSIVQE
jgi:hypothetical protein